MAIDFSLTNEQRKLQADTREFAENVLGPVVREADAEPDPLRGFQRTKEAYVAAYQAGIAFCMLPREYGGGGVTNVELIIAAEEICAVDPGFACTVLVNGLGLLPVWYWGNDEQKDRYLRAATSDPTGEYIVGYAVSEPAGAPGGTANFDTPIPHPVGIGVTASATVTNTCSTGGNTGRATSAAGMARAPTRASLSCAPIPTRAAPKGCRRSWSTGVLRASAYKLIDKMAHRLTPNADVVFDNARVPAANLVEGTEGNGDLLINRNFAWSGPVAGIAAVGVARAAYEAALDWAHTYTSGGPRPIIHYQYPGYVLGDVAAKIEMARYFCWKTAHYLDQHDYHGELIGAMCKIQCTEMLFDCVYKCMQVVGVNSLDRQHMFEKYLREAALFPLYDAGNFGMQRRRVHGVMADPSFNPRALMDDEPVEFTKAMETIDTVPGPNAAPQMAAVG